MTKTHLELSNRTACGRNAVRQSIHVQHVTCLACQNHEAFKTAKAEALALREAQFHAQVPTTVREPWTTGAMVCSECEGKTFRYRGRSCMGHNDNWVCANCGHTETRMTETGMSF